MERPIRTSLGIPTLACALWVSVALLGVADEGDRYSDWGDPVSLGPVLNTNFAEIAPCVSKDGLSLYFFSDRPGGFGGNDIYVSERSTLQHPWGPPQNLGPAINTEHDDSSAWLTADGHRLYFVSNRPGGFGGLDLWVSRRPSKRDNFSWQAPANLGSAVNTSANELTPSSFEEDETETIVLYFSSNRAGGFGGDDLYASALLPDESFGPAVLVGELSSEFLDRLPGIRRDGLEMIITSGRLGGFGSLDLWVSTRSSPWLPWAMPVNLGPVINTEHLEGGAMLSFDGTTLYFHSTRARGFPDFDLYVSTRRKLSGPR